MTKILILIFCILNFILKSQAFIDQPYYFIGPDEMHIYKQSNDTLYSYTSWSVEPPKKIDRVRDHSKIWENENLDKNYYALKLEKLDTIPLTTDPYPEDRFNIIIYQKKNNEIIFLDSKTHLTKSQMETYKLDTIDYKNNFGLTSYSLDKMRELYKLKKVTNRKDAKKINTELNSEKYHRIVDDYKKNNRNQDMYASGLMATIINQACLNIGYSPIGASVLMNVLNSKNFSAVKKKKIVQEYYEKINPE